MLRLLPAAGSLMLLAYGHRSWPVACGRRPRGLEASAVLAKASANAQLPDGTTEAALLYLCHLHWLGSKC